MLSEIASIATLALFIIYFIGRIITIFTVKRVWTDEVIFDEKRYDNYGIVEEVGNTNNCIYGLLITNTGIRNVRFYEVTEDKHGFPVEKGRHIFQKQFLNVHQAIAIKEMTGDLFPTLIIEYHTFDYMRVRLEWRDNLKSGVFSEFVTPCHTMKMNFPT